MAADTGPYADLRLSEFTQALASAEPVPGGGSASAIAASLGASLVVMVARLSVDRPKYAAFTATHRRALAAGEAARTRFLELADDDARAFAVFAIAMKMPRDTDDERTARTEAMDAAGRGAAEVPMQVVRLCRSLIEQVESLTGRSNLNASSDLDVGALLLQAAARGAGANVIINLDSIADDGYTGSLLSELEVCTHQIEEVAAQVHARAHARDLREPEAE